MKSEENTGETCRGGRDLPTILPSVLETLLCGVALFMPNGYYASAGFLGRLPLNENRHSLSGRMRG